MKIVKHNLKKERNQFKTSNAVLSNTICRSGDVSPSRAYFTVLKLIFYFSLCIPVLYFLFPCLFCPLLKRQMQFNTFFFLKGMLCKEVLQWNFWNHETPKSFVFLFPSLLSALTFGSCLLRYISSKQSYTDFKKLFWVTLILPLTLILPETNGSSPGAPRKRWSESIIKTSNQFQW